MPIYKFEDKSPKLTDPEKSWIAPTASIIGDVRLEKETSIWFGAVLRGDNELISINYGENTQKEYHDNNVNKKA